MKIVRKLKSLASRKVQYVLEPTYFSQIPLEDISQALKECGLVLLQEDNTEWAGWLCGEEGRATFSIGGYVTKRDESEDPMYIPFDNTMLLLTWYKCSSRTDGKYEVIGYLT